MSAPIGPPTRFQSSPARGGGCNRQTRTPPASGCTVSILTRPWGRVQPLERPRRVRRASPVSILTRPWGRVQRCNERVCDSWVAVSILTRPWGRVQRTHPRRRTARAVSFNPHPPVGAGATARRYARASTKFRFNPHPPVGAGATADGLRFEDMHGERVSILTRPWGRVQRGLENARERFPKRKCSSCQGVPCRALGG